MKIAIAYYSQHHGNTKKLLDAIAEKHEVTLIDVTQKQEYDLSKYDLIGFASGVYYGKLAKQLISFSGINLPDGKDIFSMYTYGGNGKDVDAELCKIADGRRCKVLGTYGCFGFDTYGPFKLVGGLKKGHPTKEEIERAVKFYEGLIQEEKPALGEQGNTSMEKWCADFELAEKPDNNVIEKYRDLVPTELMTVWERYGFGSILNGYLRFVNPDDYQQVLNDTYFLAKESLAMMVTAFGDVITWQENKYPFILKYNKRDFSAFAGGIKHLWKLLDENYVQDRYFYLDKYNDAINLYGKPKFDECFGYFPLLGTGGKEDVKNLKIVKTKEHILLISQMVGGIGF